MASGVTSEDQEWRWGGGGRGDPHASNSGTLMAGDANV